MWFGTDNGISCYDGRKFHFFPGTNRRFYFGHSFVNYYKQYVVMGTSKEGIALCYKNKVRFKHFENDENISINSALAFNDSTFLIAAIQQKGLLLVRGSQVKAIGLPSAFEKQAKAYLAVSYTHLDVYKRQGRSFGIIIPSTRCRHPAFGYS